MLAEKILPRLGNPRPTRIWIDPSVILAMALSTVDREFIMAKIAKIRL